MKRTNVNRLLVCVLALCLVLCLAPLAYAAEGDVASVTIGGTTTNYTDINKAFEAVFACDAEDEAVLKLLANCQRDSFNANVETGCFTIDLNGKTLSSNTSNYAIWMEGGTVRIIDSGTTGKVAKAVGAYGGEMTIEGGTFEDSVACGQFGNLTITGGTFAYAYINSADASMTLSGGEYASLEVYADLVNPASILAEDYYVYDADGAYISLSDIQDSGWFKMENVTVREHLFENGVCACGYACPHEAVTNTTCDACGMTYYGLYVSGELVTPENLSGDGWTYIPAEGDGPAKLVLNNAAIGGEGATHKGAGIYDVGNDALIIELEGENTVSGASFDGEAQTDMGVIGAIHSAGDLTIQGAGSLTATGHDFSKEEYNPHFYAGAGLYVRKGLTITGGDLNLSGNIGTMVSCHGNSKTLISGGNVHCSGSMSIRLESLIGMFIQGELMITGGNVTATSPVCALASYIYNNDVQFPPMKITGGTLTLIVPPNEFNFEIAAFVGTLDLSGYENCQWRTSPDGTPNKGQFLGWSNYLKIEPSDYTVTEMPSLSNHFNMDIDGMGEGEEKSYEWLPASEIALVPVLTGENQQVIGGLDEDYTYEDGYWISQAGDFTASVPVDAGDRITVTVEPYENENADYVPAVSTLNGAYVLEQGEYTFTVTEEFLTLIDSDSITIDAILTVKDPETGRVETVPAKFAITITEVGEAVEEPIPGETYILRSHITDAEGSELYFADSPLFTFEDYTHSGGAATCVTGKACQVCGVVYDTTLDPKNHVQVSETGLCACGKQMAASLTLDGNTVYYVDFDDISDTLLDLDEQAVYTVKLYQDQTYTNSNGALNFSYGTATLDLNGFTIHPGLVLLDGELTITDSSNGKGTIIEGGGYTISFHDGKLIFDDSTDCLGTGEGHGAWFVRNYSNGDQTLGTDLVLPEGYLLVKRNTGLPVTTLAKDEIGYPHIHSFSTAYSTDATQHWLECSGCKSVSGKGNHADPNKDHNCDTCAKELTQCADENGDHKCDVCGKDLSKPEGVTRLAGENRLITSYLVADQLKEKMGFEKFPNIIVASGATFADALPGSYLATARNAPILLTLAKQKYIDQTAAYIKANLAEGGTVYILGGASAVPASMETALAGITIKRVAGDDRFGTNLAILKEAGVRAGDEILVCEGKGYADSLSASATGKPILLVYKKVTDAQKSYLASLSGCKFTVVGGTTAVPDSIAKEMETYGTVTRLAGKDRLETSTMVADKYFKGAVSAVVAYGWDFPDGLCGGSLAYAMDAPLILTHSKEKLYQFTADYTVKAGLKAGYVLGGDGLVSDEATRMIFDMGNDSITVLK